MKFFLILFLFSITFSTVGQINDTLVNKLSLSIEQEYKKMYGTNNELSPTNIMYANFAAFEAGNNICFLTIRKMLLLDKNVREEKIFQNIIPIINRPFIERYYTSNNNLIEKNKDLFTKLSKYICNCSELMLKSTDRIADNNLNNCLLEYVSDSSLKNEYVEKFNALNNSDQKKFILAGLHFNHYNCETFYKKLINLTATEMTAYYKENITFYKETLLESFVISYENNKKDSAKLLFPNIDKYSYDLNMFFVKSKDNSQKKKFSYEVVKKDNELERVSSFVITRLPNNKIKIIGQIVYEIALDKPLFYIKSFKFYPREKLQNLIQMERDIQNNPPKDF